MKNIQKNRMLVLLVAFLLLASCTSGNQTETEPTVDVTGSQTETAAETEKKHPDNLPEGLDFEGYQFVILSAPGQNDTPDTNGWGSQAYYDVEGMNGEIMNDTAYFRNSAIEERLNVDIHCEEVGTNAATVVADIVHTSFLAGDAICDFISGAELYNFYTPDKLNSVMNVKELPYLELDKPYYNQKANEIFTLKNKLYFLTGDFTVSQFTFAKVVVNYDMWQDNNLENPFALVKEGKWTLDKMFSLTEGIYQDLNGNSRKDADDRLGISTRCDWYGYLHRACGGSLIRTTEDGYELTVDTERNVDILTKLVEAMSAPDICVSDYFITIWDSFENGNVLMFLGGSNMTELRRFEDIYVTILPYPKWDESQEDYAMYKAGGIMLVPSLTENPERTGAVIEALYAASTDTIKEAYIDTYVEMKVLRDEESIEMFRIIMDSLTYDFGMYIGESTHVSDNKIITNLIQRKANTLVSEWGRYESGTAKVYDDYFAELEE